MSETTTDQPIQDTLDLMTAASIANCGLDARELVLVRFAALVAAGAPAASYAVNIGAAMAADVDVMLEDARDVLLAVAPIVGTVRVVEATASIAAGLGLVLGTIQADLEDDEDEQG
jgi:hypothetical protein